MALQPGLAPRGSAALGGSASEVVLKVRRQDVFDDPNFNAVGLVNSLFYDETTLGDLDKFIAALKRQVRGMFTKCSPAGQHRNILGAQQAMLGTQRVQMVLLVAPCGRRGARGTVVRRPDGVRLDPMARRRTRRAAPAPTSDACRSRASTRRFSRRCGRRAERTRAPGACAALAARSELGLLRGARLAKQRPSASRSLHTLQPAWRRHLVSALLCTVLGAGGPQAGAGERAEPDQGAARARAGHPAQGGGVGDHGAGDLQVSHHGPGTPATAMASQWLAQRAHSPKLNTTGGRGGRSRAVVCALRPPRPCHAHRRDIRKLDYAKRHLTNGITALRRLAMLTAAVAGAPAPRRAAPAQPRPAGPLRVRTLSYACLRHGPHVRTAS